MIAKLFPPGSATEEKLKRVHKEVPSCLFHLHRLSIPILSIIWEVQREVIPVDKLKEPSLRKVIEHAGLYGNAIVTNMAWVKCKYICAVTCSEVVQSQNDKLKPQTKRLLGEVMCFKFTSVEIPQSPPFHPASLAFFSYLTRTRCRNN